MQVPSYNFACKMVSLWHKTWQEAPDIFHSVFFKVFSEKRILKKVKEFMNSCFPFPSDPSLLVEWHYWGIIITEAKVIASSEASFVIWYCEPALYGNIMLLCNSEAKNKDTPIKWNHHGPLNWMSWHTKSFTAITRVSHSSNTFLLSPRNYFDSSWQRCQNFETTGKN